MATKVRLSSGEDFRLHFAQLDGLSLIDVDEFAALLKTTPQGLRQLRFRGKLPAPAFTGQRKCVWLAGDVRSWLLNQTEHQVVTGDKQ